MTKDVSTADDWNVGDWNGDLDFISLVIISMSLDSG